MEDTLQRLLQAELQAEALVTKALARIAHRFSDFGVFRRRDLSEAT